MSFEAPISPALIRKIKKLLALSTSPNEYEAAAATAKAQEILFKYNLELGDVELLSKEGENIASPVREHPFSEIEGHATHWQTRLATAVAKTSLCVPLSQRRRRLGDDGQMHDYERLVFVGRPMDIELAKLTLDFLTEKVLKLAKAYLAESVGEGDHPGSKNTYRNYSSMREAYLDGLTAAIALRLNALFLARRNAGENSKSLVVRREAEIEDYLTEKHGGALPKTRSLHREMNAALEAMTSEAAAEAYEAGLWDGETVPITPPLKEIKD